MGAAPATPHPPPTRRRGSERGSAGPHGAVRGAEHPPPPPSPHPPPPPQAPALPAAHPGAAPFRAAPRAAPRSAPVPLRPEPRKVRGHGVPSSGCSDGFRGKREGGRIFIYVFIYTLFVLQRLSPNLCGTVVCGRRWTGWSWSADASLWKDPRPSRCQTAAPGLGSTAVQAAASPRSQGGAGCWLISGLQGAR